MFAKSPIFWRTVAPDVARLAAVSAAQDLLSKDSRRFGPTVLRNVNFEPEAILCRGDAMHFPFAASPAASNAAGACHGGCLSSVADVFTTIHLWGVHPHLRHVSVDLDINFLSPLTTGTEAVCVSRVVKSGKRLALVKFDIQVAGGVVVCRGTHNKAFI